MVLSVKQNELYDSHSRSGACKLFHALIADGMQDLQNVDVFIGILDMFSLFLIVHIEKHLQQLAV